MQALLISALLQRATSASYTVCAYSTYPTNPDSSCQDVVLLEQENTSSVFESIFSSQNDVVMYFPTALTASIDLKPFTSYPLKVTFKGQSSYSTPTIYLTYRNNYPGSSLDIDMSNFKAIFYNLDTDSDDYKLVLSSITSTSTSFIPVFTKKTNLEITLGSFNLINTAISNATTINIGKDKTSTLQSSATTLNIIFVDEGIKVGSSVIKGEKATLNFASTSSYASSYTLSLTAEGSAVDVSKGPKIAIDNVATVTVSGDFTTPENKDEIGLITSTGAFSSSTLKATVSSSVVPFSFSASSLEFTLSKSVQFYGSLSASNSYSSTVSDNIIFTSAASELITLGLGTVDGYVSIESPKIQTTIDYLSVTKGSNHYFPLATSFDADSVSSITVKAYSHQYDFSSIRLRSFISDTMTDDDLQRLGFFDGKTVITFPSENETLPDNLTITYNDNPKTVFGFTQNANCLSITKTESGNNYVIGIKASSLFDLPYSICFASSSSSCSSYTQYGGSVTAMTDLSKVIPEGLKVRTIGIYISSYSASIVNLSSYNFESSDVSINPSTSFSIEVTVIADPCNAGSLILNSLTLKGENNISVPSLSITSCSLSSGATFNIPENAIVTSDPSSLKLIQNSLFDQLTVSAKNDVKVTYYDDNYSITHLSTEYRLMYPTLSSLVIVTESTMSIKMGITQQISVSGFEVQTTKDTTVTLEGDWTIAQFSSNIILNHSTNALTLVYTRANQGSSVKQIGSGKFHTMISYGSPVDYCVYVLDKSQCSGNKIINASEFDTTVEELINSGINNINLLIADSTSEDPLVVSYDSLNNGEISFKLKNSFSNVAQFVLFKPNTTKISTEYTKITFEKVGVDFELSESQNITFGELVLSNCNISDRTKNYVDLVATSIVCTYVDLASFKSVTIKDEIILSGNEIPESSVNVYFEQDDNNNDLQATLTDDTTIVIGESKVMIGGITFHITRSNNYDALFSLRQTTTILYDNVSNVNHMPKVTLSVEDSAQADINFFGHWPDEFPDVFQVVSKSQSYISIAMDDIIPADFRNISRIYFTALSSGAGVGGGIELKSTTSGDNYLTFDSKINNSRVAFSVLDDIIVPNATSSMGTILIKSPFIDLSIKNIKSTDDNELSIKIKYEIDPNGVPSINVKEIIDSSIVFSPIALDIDNFPVKYNESSSTLFSGPITLFSTGSKALPNSLTAEFTWTSSIFGSGPVLHGINTPVGSTVFNFKQSNVLGVSSLVMEANALPSEIPMKVKVGGSSSDAYEYTASTPSAIFDVLPQILKELEISFEEDGSDSKALNLDQFYDSVTYLDLKSINTQIRKVYVTLGTSKKAHLDLNSVNIIASSTNAKSTPVLTANNFVAVDSRIDSSIKISNSSFNTISVDIDTLSTIVSNSVIEGKLEIPVTINSVHALHFTNNGWVVSEGKGMSQSNLDEGYFSNLNFLSDGELQLYVNDGVKQVKPTKITLTANRYEEPVVRLGKNWVNVADPENVVINFNDIEPRVYTTSYPIPNIFASEIDKIAFGVAEEESNAKVNLSLPAGTVIDEPIEFDLTEINQAESRVLSGTTIGFDGLKASVAFRDNAGTLEVETLTFNNNTKVSSISNTTVTKKAILLENTIGGGDVDFKSGSILELQWERNLIPHFQLSENPNYVPKVSIKFVGNDFDAKHYDEIIGHKDFTIISGQFDCESFKSNTLFESNIDQFSNSSSSALSLKCSQNLGDWNLVLSVAKLVDDESGQSGGNVNPANTGMIVGVSIAAVVIVAVVVGVVVYFATRKKYLGLLNESMLESSHTDVYTDGGENEI